MAAKLGENIDKLLTVLICIHAFKFLRTWQRLAMLVFDRYQMASRGK